MAYTPRRHGDLKVTDEAPYWEGLIYSAPGVSIPNNSGWVGYSVGSFTLPWPGQAVLEAQVMLEWGGHQQVAAYINPSPPSVAATQGNKIGCHIYANKITWLPVYARWELAAVQTVTLNLNVYVAGGGSAVTFHYIYGYIRGTPQ